MPWTNGNITALSDIDLAYLAGDAANARSHNMNPYGDEAVAVMAAECAKRGINVIFDDNGKAHPLSDLKEQV